MRKLRGMGRRGGMLLAVGVVVGGLLAVGWWSWERAFPLRPRFVIA